MNTSPQAPARSPDRTTAILRSSHFQGHDTGSHPENPGRLAAIEAELTRQRLLTGRPEIPFAEATTEQVTRVHDPAYLAVLERLTRAGGGPLDPDTVVRPDSLSVSRLAAGAAVAATDATLDGHIQRAFCLVRPPGHHATPSRGMGFCLLNAIAIAATHAVARGVDRVAIIDWDVHHGNGTQDAFYETDRVLYCSIHQSPLYPGTGGADEIGTGRGKGFTLNVPVLPGTGDEAYSRLFDTVILPRLQDFHPQLVFVSAGFDAHAADPLASNRVTERGFVGLTERVMALAEEESAGRLVAILEGGYHPDALARSVAAVVTTMDNATKPERHDSASTSPSSTQVWATEVT
jgi:acetoin utilization deacetylase AcuC-like enzyme